jgi:hypothetical protein
MEDLMYIARQITKFSFATAAVALTLAACGGGGGSSAGGTLPSIANQPQGPIAAAATKIGVTLSGNAPVAARSRATSSSLPVTVTYNGATVATGTLDGSGFAELNFTQNVPAGATVTVTIGTTSPVVATVTLATAISATAADIVYSAGPPPTITVTAADDNNGDGQVSSGDTQVQVSTENPSDGQPENVNSEGDVLPANLPVTIATCGTTTITVAPATGAPSGLGLLFEEKVSDSDNSPKFQYQTSAFTGPLNFPYLSSAARIDMRVTQNGNPLVSVEAPIGAFTSGSPASPSPAPATCPSPMPMPTPGATMTPEPSWPEPTWAPSAQPSPGATPTP